MKTKYIYLLLVLAIISLFGCASSSLVQATSSFQKGHFIETETILKHFVETKKAKNDPAYPLMLLTLADSQFRLGDYQAALKSYDAAIKSMTLRISTVRTGIELLKNEQNRLYRGTPHELAFAHYYKGICYFQINDFEKARIEFTQARLADKGEKIGQENDITIIHFMEGLCYIRLNDFDEAKIAFQKVIELKPEFPYGWLELTYISDKLGFQEKADIYWNKYLAIVPKEQQLSRVGDSSCVFIIADLGKGPYKTPNLIFSAYANYRKGKYIEDGVEINLSKNKFGKSYNSDDMYFQAKSEGGFTGELGRKVVSVIAKSAISSLIPFSHLFLTSSADIRGWYTLSGEIHVAILPVKDDFNYVLNLDFYNDIKNRGKQYLDHFEQNWYYISPQQHSKIKPVYVKSLYDLHNMNVDHISISETIEKQNAKNIRQIKKEKK